jgi:putrescine carbamoyltransferase
MTLRHLIETQHYTKNELLDLIELIRMMKEAEGQGVTPRLLAGASLGMIFEEPSTRTRISFEVATRRRAF